MNGLSLCIQGTYIGGFLVVVPFRFIPVHTGNIKPIVAYVHGMAVYPCAYREHHQIVLVAGDADGLSLCIQGTYLWQNVNLHGNRFIPVHTGNIQSILPRLYLPAVYPCAYREHVMLGNKTAEVRGLSLCIQGTSILDDNADFQYRFIPVHTGNILKQ